MSSERESAIAPSQQITTARVGTRPDDAWLFFDDIHDVTNLDPAEEAGESWEATVAGERVGMAVVDKIPSNHVFICRIAVVEPHRRTGVATALLTALREEYGRLACRVHERNDASHALVQSVGFQRVDSRFPELRRYDTDADRDA